MKFAFLFYNKLLLLNKEEDQEVKAEKLRTQIPIIAYSMRDLDAGFDIYSDYE